MRAAETVDIDAVLGEHTDATLQFLASDGEIIDGETGDEVSDESESTTTWSDPELETDKYGKPTGDHYVRCEDCGIEILTALSDCANHREGCSQ